MLQRGEAEGQRREQSVAKKKARPKANATAAAQGIDNGKARPKADAVLLIPPPAP